MGHYNKTVITVTKAMKDLDSGEGILGLSVGRHNIVKTLTISAESEDS